jgi:2-keto-3-deoxy-L-fuconate dehydrogenase
VDKLAGLSAPGLRTAQLDVLSPTSVATLAAEVPDGVDILFNCAGVVHAGALLECSYADWTFAFELNVTSMFRMIRAFLPGMIKRGGGSIINIRVRRR